MSEGSESVNSIRILYNYIKKCAGFKLNWFLDTRNLLRFLSGISAWIKKTDQRTSRSQPFLSFQKFLPFSLKISKHRNHNQTYTRQTDSKKSFDSRKPKRLSVVKDLI